jgi:hypothetical protein
MRKIRIQRTMEAAQGGVPVQYFEIDVSTVDELPFDGMLGGIKMRHGSIARVVQTGAFWSWDGATEAWYNQDGSTVQNVGGDDE